MFISSTSDLFTAGQGPYFHIRIPGVVTTPAGRVLAYCEARHGRDDGQPSDIVMRASDDGGHTRVRDSKPYGATPGGA